jgi:hypothetical protein
MPWRCARRYQTFDLDRSVDVGLGEDFFFKQKASGQLYLI